ncbi:band 7 protein AGAP004871-like [Rhagoletis pomonella]|uniref:band 7 protein AGAP004871-like n=1 Tax=Rhagoletis pomonella TaxID=28610 RepID=UPI00178735C5|nr:band 7 protein AGAP004871-like [Rhagoletis pomonella]
MSRQRREIRYFATSENQKPSYIEQAIVFSSLLLVVLTFPISIFLCLIVMSEYQRAVIFRCGRLRCVLYCMLHIYVHTYILIYLCHRCRCGGARGPGLVFRIPCIDYCVRVDLRTISYDVPAQEILTKDHVTISLDAAVYYRIFDPLLAVIQVENVHFATRMLAQATLRNIAGQKHVLELMSEKDAVSMAMAAILKSATSPWGVYVERVEIKDVRLPLNLQRAMAAEAEAIREAKAKVVSADGELSASKALKAAADVIASNPVALQLRYLQTLSLISGDQNKNIIFPFPVNLIKQLVLGSQASTSKKTLTRELPEEGDLCTGRLFNLLFSLTIDLEKNSNRNMLWQEKRIANIMRVRQ